MALLTEMITGTKISESAYLCLRLAWLYDGRIEELRSQNASEEIINQHLKSQQEYIQDAYKGFKEAVQTQYPPICGMDENTINYLLASLGIKCKDYGTAKQFASSIVTSRSAQAGLKEKARGLLGQIKANLFHRQKIHLFPQRDICMLTAVCSKSFLSLLCTNGCHRISDIRCQICIYRVFRLL